MNLPTFAASIASPLRRRLPPGRPMVRGGRLALVLSLAVLLPAAGCATFSASAGAPRTVVIGADLSLSGADAATGRMLANALELQVRSLNDQHAVHFGKLTLSVRDNRSDPGTSVANIRAFQRDQSVAAAVTGPCDDCLTASATEISAGDLPVISLATIDLPDTVGEQSPLFKLAPNATDDAVALADLLAEKKAQTVGVLAAPGGYGDEAAAALRSALGSEHRTLTTTVRLTGSTGTAVQSVLYHDYQPPDAVVVSAPPEQSRTTVRSLRRQGYQGTIALDATATDDLFLPDNSLNGCYLVYPPILAMDDQVASTPAKAAQKQWFDNYVSRYGRYAGPSSFAGDALQVIAVGLAATRGTNRGKLHSAVQNTELDGLSGPIRFTPDNHSGLTPQSLTILKAAADKRWHLITDGS
jgi:branched-chain amino acid transport system substrate-binding protein